MSNYLIDDDTQNIIYYYFLFNKEGLCIFEKQLETENNVFISQKKYNSFKILLKKVSMILLKNDDNNEQFLFNRIIFDKYKIVFLLKDNIALVGLFPVRSSCSYQNLLLIHLYISFINFKGDSIYKINLIKTNMSNNNVFYTLQNYVTDNIDKIKNNEIKNITNIDFLEISIYDKYFLKYCIIHFCKVLESLTKREDIDLSYTKFINLYIIDVDKEQILFDLSNIQNIKCRKYYHDNNLFKEILFHSQELYKSYLEKYSMRFTKVDSSQRFVKFECTSTYPRLLFIIKFIPILKGVVIVHIYNQKKLSRGNNNNLISINHDNKYKEIDLVFGSFVNNENCGIDLKYVMPKKLNEIETFCEEFFITTRNNDMFKLNDPQKQFKYFNYNIINIINTIPMEVVDNYPNKIFEYINEKIKEKYLEEYEKNKRKKIPKNENKKDLDKRNNKNDSFEKLLLIDKNLIYNDLFQNQNNIMSLQISEKKNNTSTIKSNKNIINILREPEKSINNNSNNNNKSIMKNKIINQIKEDNSIQSDKKSLQLMSESNLLSKDEDCSNNIMIDNFSLISEIKKKNDNSFKILLKKYKNDNSSLKKIELQDLLNDTNSKNDLNSISTNRKEKNKSRNIKESESDFFRKETDNNVMIKKEEEKNGKMKKKLKMFNNELD